MDRTRGLLFFSSLLAVMLCADWVAAQSSTGRLLHSAEIANSLIAYGRAHRDPESIIAAAGILAKSVPDERFPSRDLRLLLNEAMALRPDDHMLVALADRVADEDATDDEEKSRQAPAYLQSRPAPAPPQGAPDDGSTNSATDSADGAVSEATATIPAYEYTFIEISLTVGLLVFGAVLVGMQVLLMITQRRYWDDWSIKVTGLTLVITSGLLLIVAGYSEEQAAPMMGMLGTVAGYLLGKEGSSQS